jgi:hypothetical protein
MLYATYEQIKKHCLQVYICFQRGLNSERKNGLDIRGRELNKGDSLPLFGKADVIF